MRRGVVPHVVVGDLDSLSLPAQRRLRSAGRELVQLPARKDETDLELALLQAVERGATEIDVVGALGGRIDHTLGNIFLLTMPQLAGTQVRIVDDGAELWVARESTEVPGTPGDLVSLIPLTPEVRGIVTEGLEYRLNGDSLYMGAARGVSNVMTAKRATVTLESGLLLVVKQVAKSNGTRG
jgi:thiamine pyrophosphokinase